MVFAAENVFPKIVFVAENVLPKMVFVAEKALPNLGAGLPKVVVLPENTLPTLMLRSPILGSTADKPKEVMMEQEFEIDQKN